MTRLSAFHYDEREAECTDMYFGRCLATTPDKRLALLISR